MSNSHSHIQKDIIPVLGMSCAACAGSAQQVVRNQDGVVDAQVNFATGYLSVTYHTETTNLEKLQKALQSAGYDLLIEKENQQQTLEKLHQQNYQKIKRNTIWALILAFPVVVVGMFFMNIPYANLIMWAFSTPVVLWFGRSFFIGAWKQFKHRTANMDTLVALSTGIAYFFSVFNMLFADFWHQRGLHAHVYFEAAAVIIAFILLGKLLEEKAKGNTSTALEKLMGLQPKTVLVLDRMGNESEIPIDNIKKGDILLVKPGEKIAVDGKVIWGNSYIDESMLTGEPIAISKKPDDLVYAGTINQKGSLKIIALKIGKETFLSHIIRTVQEAQGSKAPVQNLVDRIARIFVPTVLLISVFTFIIWMIFGGVNAFNQALLSAITILVIACPCALGLATPTAIMVGIGKAAEMGILVKDAESLETTHKIDALLLDKTGTITKGKPTVTNIFWNHIDDKYATILASIESKSEHPLADAIVFYLNEKKTLDIENFQSITGKGVQASYNKETFYIGNQKFIQNQKIDIPEELLLRAEKWAHQSQTVIWYAHEKEILALIAIADEIKPTSAQAIADLKSQNIEVYMLTGDNGHTAKKIAQQTHITHYVAEMLPQEKADFVKKLQKEGKIVAMVGDGINDSTALATADVSIAMGKGSDIAIDVAKMTIISSDLTKISQAIRLSKHTVRTIRQNLFWAFIYNLIGIPLAAGILYPINGFLLNPMIAGAAMALSSVSVVSNSLLLKLKKL